MSLPSAGLALSPLDMATKPGVPEPVTAPSSGAPCGMSAPDEVPTSAEAAMEALHVRLASHPFWDNRLLRACRRGMLTREDHALIFSQYALLTRSATRFLHALLAQCDSETGCARLTQALWEEVGAPPPEKRPAALFRRFLREGLGVDADATRFLDATRYFVRECMDVCLRAPPCEASAFLALGLEAPLPRLYSLFVDGLLKAGVSERHLPFFYRRMDPGSARASMLEALVLSHVHEPGWFERCAGAMERALELQGHFFDGLFEAVQQRRLSPLMERIQARLPLAPEQPEPRTIHLGEVSQLVPHYRHAHEWRGIDFTVDPVPFGAEVLETQVLRVAPGRTDEAREHAHELLLVVLAGTGRVHVRGTAVDVKPGDAVFVPRWASHQACNTGAEPLALLAVTDHGLTRRAHEEELLRTARILRETGNTR
ncbi:cupin domain-containing protein [Hyalangium rubrum]|uniref:Cupin domain-containing protein n=1 Tax=Hyalangium rubrum TaxID=3103134 RepID=A0ABU5HA27_9BACT|nr:cupin domain-containing protein [Hyalangium sp. s54d21]MDY7230175.1 cupin domain-containing protein [Hyalangium sp. s54d21]